MIKPDHWIRTWAEAGGVDPFEPSQVNAARYDVCVSAHRICPTRDPGSSSHSQGRRGTTLARVDD